MHELSLATEIIDLIQPHIPAGEQLDSVTVTVGLLSGICANSLQFCFSELARQEGLAGAVLVINQPPAQYRCSACLEDYPVDHVEQCCPFCSASERIMLSGAEFTVDFIELKEGEPHV